MGRMEYGKMMAGFAAALTTQTGKIGYLGPLINEETRRLAASAYLGARYAWETVLKKDPQDLDIPGDLDRFLVQYPRRDGRSHSGGAELLQHRATMS